MTALDHPRLNEFANAKRIVKAKNNRRCFEKFERSQSRECPEAVRRFGTDAAELSHAAGAQLADQLAVCLTARIAMALQRTTSAEDDPAKQLRQLRELCADLVALRRGDHNTQWLRIERDKLDLDFKKYDEQAAARKKAQEAVKQTNKGGLTKETLDLIERELKLL